MRRSALALALATLLGSGLARAQSSAAFPDPAAGPPASGSATAAGTGPGQSAAQPLAYAGASWTGTRQASPTYGGSSAYGGYQPQSSGYGLSLSGPVYLPYRMGRAILAGYQLEETRPTAPLVYGAVAVALPYVTGLGIGAAESFDNGSGWLALPVLGPWAALGARSDPCAGIVDEQQPMAPVDDSKVGRCVAEPLVRGLLVLDGVLQAAGGVLLIVGASTKERRLVRADVARVVATPRLVGKRGLGVGVTGIF